MDFRRFLIAFFGGVAFASAATVPFVGCAADGQVGPEPAPKGKPVEVAIPPEVARRLAHYETGVFSVLAPRGWHCFEVYGSSGSLIYVGHEAFKDLKSFGDATRGGIDGPAVFLDNSDGGTSGGVDVAEVIEQVFPKHKAFADDVYKLYDQKPSGPDRTDTLTYRSAEIVEYTTPANAQGLGTRSRFKPGAPVHGVAILSGSAPDLLLLSVRLPSELSDLTPLIIQQLERDFPTIH